jgi:GntR family transcriptional regulator
LLFRVHSASGIPIYLQIESQVRQAVAAGLLNQGDQLPSVRGLAAELRVNPNTVARALQNLERDGIIRTVPGSGCYVSRQSPGLLRSEKIRRLKPLAMQLAVEACQLCLSHKETIELLEESFSELGGSNDRIRN